MAMLDYYLENFQLALLVMIRIGAIMAVAPFFASSVITYRMRFILSFWLTVLMAPLLINTLKVNITTNFLQFSFFAMEQALIGLIIGFMASSVFSAFQLSGQYFSIQIGFGMNEVVDPIGQVSIPIVGQFINLMSILIFLAINGPHLIIQTLYLSFKILPMAVWNSISSALLLKTAAKAFVGMFLIAFKLAIPVMGTIFVISTAMGLLTKVAPQMNVMMLSFPLKILVTFIILFLLTPVMTGLISDALLRIFAFTDNMILEWSRIS
jgi:flagellar biosynthetic protein FliR